MEKGGTLAEEGLSPESFSLYKKVISGHYHTKSTIKNIVYTGTPFEFTWADWNDPKGFWTMEVDTGELEFIENPVKIFYKVQIKDGSVDIVPPKDCSFKDKYIKIEIDNDDTAKLEKIVQLI